MDRVRLGRALGFGARAAAKTLVQAADAAMSPNPNAAAKTAQPPAASQTTPSSPAPRSAPRSGNIVTAAGHMGRTAWAPVKRHSRELWLQVTGSFFALLALSMGGGIWAMRLTVRAAFQASHTNHAVLWSPDALKFYLAAAAFLMFAYFAVSNFIRAGRNSPPRSR